MKDLNPSKPRKLIAVWVSAVALSCAGCEIVQWLHEKELQNREQYDRLKAQSEPGQEQPISTGLNDSPPPTVPAPE